MFQQAGANNFLHTSQKFDFEPPSLLCVSLLVPSPNSLEISQIWVPSTSFDISQTLVLPSTSLDISQNRVPSTSPDISQIWVPCSLNITLHLSNLGSLNITRHLSTLLSPNSLDTIRWPPGSKQAFRSGQPLAAGYKACLWSIIGDLDYFVSILRLPNFNSQRPCSLCRCSLAGANSWSNFTPSAPWRGQLWTYATWSAWGGRSRCPLFGRLSHCSALTVHLDYMHCKFLGVDQYVFGSVLALLTCEVMPGSPQQNLDLLWSEIKHLYHQHNTKVRYRYLNKLTMFLRQNGTPKLRGKAGEIRHFADIIVHLWQRHMSSELLVHKQIHLLLKLSARMEQLITDNREEIAFPPPEARKFATACQEMLSLHAVLANHFAEEETDLFTLTSKCHMLQHISLLAGCINPRLVWCFSGEDMQNRVQQLAQASVKGNNAASAVNKIVRHYRLAMQIAFMDHEDEI